MGHERRSRPRPVLCAKAYPKARFPVTMRAFQLLAAHGVVTRRPSRKAIVQTAANAYTSS